MIETDDLKNYISLVSNKKFVLNALKWNFDLIWTISHEILDIVDFDIGFDLYFGEFY